MELRYDWVLKMVLTRHYYILVNPMNGLEEIGQNLDCKTVIHKFLSGSLQVTKKDAKELKLFCQNVHLVVLICNISKILWIDWKK